MEASRVKLKNKTEAISESRLEAVQVNEDEEGRTRKILEANKRDMRSYSCDEESCDNFHSKYRRK
jgi:hypothetical protein